jgi:hypothetical protein
MNKIKRKMNLFVLNVRNVAKCPQPYKMVPNVAPYSAAYIFVATATFMYMLTVSNL